MEGVKPKKAVQDRIHTLILPLAQFSLLVPSALVAEVVNVSEVGTLPLAPPWLLGIMNWRARPVPVISFDYLLDTPVPVATARAKIVIFYPLQGRKPWEFFGLMSNAEPQPRTFQDPEALSNRVANESPYIATALQLDKYVVGIPELGALKRLFYPPN